MPKNIILCCDGTNNQFSGDHTNVIRIYKVVEKNEGQVTFYDPGVGTMPEPWKTTWVGKWLSMMSGLATGRGLTENIGDAYKFLMANYEPGDRVYLFGFSRGAYTARCVAALLHSIGLLHKGSENLLEYGLLYWQKDFGPNSVGGKMCREFKSTLGRECPVHFIGVWDTVGSVGYFSHFKTFPYTAHNPDVAHVRHAVSIDERRSTFRQNLMSPASQSQDIKNVWFAGVHSDVGGGYPPKESGLAKITFKWMMKEASACGLKVSEPDLNREVELEGQPPDASAPVHVSLHGTWWLGELLPVLRYSFADGKRHWHWLWWGGFNQPRNPITDNQLPYVALHASVLEKLARDPSYQPANIPHDEASLRSIFPIEI